MIKWTTTMSVILALAADERTGTSSRPAGIATASGVGRPTVDAVLSELVSGGFAWSTAAPERVYGLTPRGHRVDEVLATLLEPRMDRVTKAFVAALKLAVGGPRGGWLSAAELAVILQVDVTKIFRGPLFRMTEAQVRLERAGLVEYRDSRTDRSPWSGDYRLRSWWGPTGLEAESASEGPAEDDTADDDQ